MDGLTPTLFFLRVFEEEALTWEDRLNRISALFDVWIDVQRRWVYLEGIFTESADIKVIATTLLSHLNREKMESNLSVPGSKESHLNIHLLRAAKLATL